MKYPTFVLRFLGSPKTGSARLLFGAITLSLFAALCGCEAGGKSIAAADPNIKPASEGGVLLPAPNEIPPRITIPGGTNISVRLLQSIHSQRSAAGSEFVAEVASPVQIEGNVAIPQGTRVRGRIVDAHPSGRFNNPGYLRLTLDSIQTSEGRWLIIHTSSISAKGGSHKKRNTALIAGGAGFGGLIGGLAGGAKGLGIGLASGAGAGAAGAFVTGKKDVAFAAERKLTFAFTEPLELSQ